MQPTATVLPLDLTDTLDADSSVVYVLDRTLRILYCNPAWDVFARANNGALTLSSLVVGKPVTRFISGPMQGYYTNAFNDVFRTGKVWQHRYECSSPLLFRTFSLNAMPVVNATLQVVSHFLDVVHPHGADRVAMVPSSAQYRTGKGILAMCSGCRRTRRTNEPDRWDWVPSYAANMPGGVSHSLCPVCILHYFPSQRRRIPNPDQ